MRRHLIIGIALTAAAFHLFAAGISPFTALVQRPIHLALMATPVSYTHLRAPEPLR